LNKVKLDWILIAEIRFTEGLYILNMAASGIDF